MKLADIRPGGIYAYREGRHYGSYWPMLVLDTTPYLIPRSFPSGPRPPEKAPGTRLRRGDHFHGPVGLLGAQASFYADSPDYEAKLYQLLDLTSASEFSPNSVIEDEDGTQLGQYKLITSLAYLHGDYLAVTEQERQKAEHDREVVKAVEAYRIENDQTFTELAARLAALGIEPVSKGRWDRQLVLTFEQARALLDLISEEPAD